MESTCGRACDLTKAFKLLLTSACAQRLSTDRLYWNGYDPYNIAEALFALANIISFARVSFVLPANELFGPMQISLARMITASGLFRI